MLFRSCGDYNVAYYSRRGFTRMEERIVADQHARGGVKWNLKGYAMLMPPPSDKPGQSEKLTAAQVGILRAWIDQGAEWPDGPIREVAVSVTFAGDIGPMLKASCGACHSGAGAKGGFGIETVAAVLKGGSSYGVVVTPSNPGKSSLLTIIEGKDEDLPQPEKHKLQPKQVKQVRTWIEQGAK